MLESVSNWGKRGPNTSHAAARTSFCRNTWGGADVASEIRAAFEIKAFDIVRFSRMIGTRMETFLDREYFEGLQNNQNLRGHYKLTPIHSKRASGRDVARPSFGPVLRGSRPLRVPPDSTRSRFRCST